MLIVALHWHLRAPSRRPPVARVARRMPRVANRVPPQPVS
jgi:hypothetical protein